MPFFIRILQRSKYLIIPMVCLIGFTSNIQPKALMGYLNINLVKQCQRTNCDMLKMKFPNPNQLTTNLVSDRVNILQSSQLWLYGQAPKARGRVDVMLGEKLYKRLSIDNNGHFYALLDLPTKQQNHELSIHVGSSVKQYSLKVKGSEENDPKAKILSFCNQSLSGTQAGQAFETPVECERNSLNLKLTQAKADYFEVFWNSVLYGSLALNNTENQVVTIQAPDKVVNHLSQNQVHRVTLLPKEFEVDGEPDPEIIYYKILE